ncbi:hypothetical protein NXS19_001610 [Fusarium pseudograminearum]|nr:hypothetical protein NXS19_001610 [Fusarium pseudograminearum]
MAERRHCDKTVLLRPKCNPSRATSIKLHGHNRNNNTMCLTSHTATLTSSGERAPMVIPKGCRWLRAPNGADHRVAPRVPIKTGRRENSVSQ